MKQSLGLNLTQNLTMTPALQQAIRMLQLSTLDLKTEIQDALESNVMLEADEGPVEVTQTSEPDTSASSQADSSDADIPEALPVDADWNDVYAGSAPPAPAADDADYWEYRQASLTSTPDLHAHLSWQADMAPLSATQRAIADHMIDAVNAHGLIEDWPGLQAHLLDEYQTDAHTLDRILATVQEFDPPGVAARGLAECLTLQLGQLDETTAGRALALRIVADEPLESLADSNHEALAERLAVPPKRAETAIALIRSLQPHPGEAFIQPETDYIVPEVFVSRQASRWQVTLNPEIAPKLRINDEYMGLINRTDKSADQSTLKSHLQEARFFLNSLKSRNDTLLDVAQRIVEAQRAFLEYGDEAMKPLVLREVAEELEIHESTVSRATANKYMQTPRGVFELKYFFSSQVATTDGGAASATAIQAMIKRMIAEETPSKPLSDSKLTELLLDNGIRVARRTVAKYREALSIAPSSQRRRKTG